MSGFKASQPLFQATKGNHEQGEIKVTPLLRAKDLVAQSNAWAAPDLQAEMARAAHLAFERVLKTAHAEVAQDLEKMRQSTLSQARQEGLAQGTQLGTQQGYEAGYAQGYNEAKAVLEAEFAAKNSEWDAQRDALKSQLTEDWQVLIASVTQSLTALDMPLLQDIVWLSGQMAKRLVMGELHLAPERINALVASVIEQLPRVTYPLVIRLHPDDVALIDLLALPQEGRVELLPDVNLVRGECIVKSGHSDVVLNWQEQTQKVIDAALQALMAPEQSIHGG
jgi:flagellar biosynthesis/type III secretory pathway protein FliH